jgi:hypothetical protein
MIFLPDSLLAFLVLVFPGNSKAAAYGHRCKKYAVRGQPRIG